MLHPAAAALADPDRALTIAGFLAELQQALAESAGRVVALLVISLHRSDRIACLLGEPGAAIVTQQLQQRVRAMMRPADRMVMVADDELWLLLPGLRVQAMAALAVSRLLANLEPVFMQDGRSMFIRPCIGMACAPANADQADSLLRAADQARQLARSSHLTHATSTLLGTSGGVPDDIENALRRVLAANALTVAYQPKIDLHTGRVASVEALVRWPANDSQVVPTVLMVETAERAGLIGSLTNLVLNNVLRERSGWAQQGLDMQVWVNLSAQSLAQKELPATLLQSLEVWNVPSSAIGLEITESGLISDIEHTTGILQALRNVGFELAIDDFGTGYSSLAYLRRFPISELKIDRMFVHGMVNSPPDRQIVQSIIDLAHNFNLKVVAEGAEDLDTVAALKSLGCDVVQGYVYAKPMPAEHIPDWVRRFEAG